MTTPDPIVARVCVCGHVEADHDGECMFGWTGEPDEDECDCLAFVLAFALSEPKHVQAHARLEADVLLGFDRKRDMLRGACSRCDGGGCQRCDHTGFRPDQRTFSTGYGWRRLVFWPWHYGQHVRRGHTNGWYSVLFCTWCVDDRVRALSEPKPWTPTPDPLTCGEYTTTRSDVSSRFDQSYRCGKPVKFQVLVRWESRWVRMCGVHARFARLSGLTTEPTA